MKPQSAQRDSLYTKIYMEYLGVLIAFLCVLCG